MSVCVCGTACTYMSAHIPKRGHCRLLELLTETYTTRQPRQGHPHPPSSSSSSCPAASSSLGRCCAAETELGTWQARTLSTQPSSESRTMVCSLLVLTSGSSLRGPHLTLQTCQDSRSPRRSQVRSVCPIWQQQLSAFLLGEQKPRLPL